MVVWVDDNFVKYDFVLSIKIPSSDDSFDSRIELRKVERLDYIIVCPNFQSGNTILDGISC